MKLFKIYTHPTLEMEIVKANGFSWGALFVVFFSLLLISRIFMNLITDPGLILFIVIIVPIVMGILWPKIHTEALEKHGYTNIKTIEARTKDEASAFFATGKGEPTTKEKDRESKKNYDALGREI